MIWRGRVWLGSGCANWPCFYRPALPLGEEAPCEESHYYPRECLPLDEEASCAETCDYPLFVITPFLIKDTWNHHLKTREIDFHKFKHVHAFSRWAQALTTIQKQLQVSDMAMLGLEPSAHRCTYAHSCPQHRNHSTCKIEKQHPEQNRVSVQIYNLGILLTSPVSKPWKKNWVCFPKFRVFPRSLHFSSWFGPDFWRQWGSRAQSLVSRPALIQWESSNSGWKWKVRTTDEDSEDILTWKNIHMDRGITTASEHA